MIRQVSIKEFGLNTRLHQMFKISKALTLHNITPSQAAANPLRQLSSNFHLIPLSTGVTDRCVPALVCVCVAGIS